MQKKWEKYKKMNKSEAKKWVFKWKFKSNDNDEKHIKA